MHIKHQIDDFFIIEGSYFRQIQQNHFCESLICESLDSQMILLDFTDVAAYLNCHADPKGAIITR